MSTNFGRPPIDDPFSAFIAGRRDKEQRVFQQRDKTLDFLQQIAGSASPEYHDTLVDLMSQVVGASGDKKGQKQIQDALGQIHQITKGLGPNVQNKTNDFAGYQGAGAENSITPTAPTTSPVSDNISAAISNPNTTAAPAGPVSMLSRYGSSANFATPTSLTAPVGAPATAPVSLIGNDDIQGGGLMAQPPAAGGVSMIKAPAPVQLNSTVAKPGFQVQGRVPLIEDPVARKLREQNALNPGLIDLYRGKTNATTQSKIAINRAKIDDQLDKDLALIDPKMRAQVKAYATRGVMKRISDLGGDPTNPDDVKEATGQITAEIKQNLEEHNQRIQAMKDNSAGLKRKLDDADKNYELKKQALDLQKTNSSNLQEWRTQQTQLAQTKRDVDQIKVRHAAAQRDLDRIGRDPRLLNPDKYPEVARQLQSAEDNLRNIEDDLQSAGEGKPGAAQATRETAAGGAPKGSSGKVVSAAELQKYATDNGVSVDKAKEAYLHNARAHGLTITFQ